MNKLAYALAAVVALAGSGCKTHVADCASAINHSMSLAKADMQKTPGMDDRMLAKLHDLGVQHCKDDKWPDEAIHCMTDATTKEEAQACYGKLSKDQQDKMNQAAMDAAKPGPAAPEPAPSK